jgi:hypothetical protein
MRIDVTLWYRLITKGVITPNCYDGNSTISSSMPTSPTSLHYHQYETTQSDTLHPTESGPFSPTNPTYSQFDDVNIQIKFEIILLIYLGYISSTSRSICSSYSYNK